MNLEQKFKMKTEEQIKKGNMVFTKKEDLVLILEVVKGGFLVDNNINKFFIKKNEVKEVF